MNQSETYQKPQVCETEAGCFVDVVHQSPGGGYHNVHSTLIAS
jgi:hypothetical protein